MKNQNGGALIALIVLLLIIFSVVGVFWNYANKAVDFEADISRFDKNSQNTLSNYTLKLKEAAQIPDMYFEDLKILVNDTFSGRYGADGSQAAFQWIQERNIPLDSQIYRDLTILISSGRDEFKLSQDRKIEICTDYEKLYTRPVSKFILDIMNYPNSKVMDMCKIVLDVQTIETFKTGIAEPIKI